MMIVEMEGWFALPVTMSNYGYEQKIPFASFSIIVTFWKRSGSLGKHNFMTQVTSLLICSFIALFVSCNKKEGEEWFSDYKGEQITNSEFEEFLSRHIDDRNSP